MDFHVETDSNFCRFDVLECSISDTKPRFQLPPSFKTPSLPQGVLSPSLQNLLPRLAVSSDTHARIATALAASARLAHFVNQHAQEPHFWKHAVTVARFITPIMHLLLSLPRPAEHNPDGVESSEVIHLELIRLALLIVLARLKQAFSLISEELPILEERFLDLWCTAPYHDERFPELALWAHIIIATREQIPAKDFHANAITMVMKFMRIRNSKDAVQSAKQLVWIDALMNPGAISLESDVGNALRHFLTPQ